VPTRYGAWFVALFNRKKVSKGGENPPHDTSSFDFDLVNWFTKKLQIRRLRPLGERDVDVVVGEPAKKAARKPIAGTGVATKEVQKSEQAAVSTHSGDVGRVYIPGRLTEVREATLRAPATRSQTGGALGDPAHGVEGSPSAASSDFSHVASPFQPGGGGDSGNGSGGGGSQPGNGGGMDDSKKTRFVAAVGILVGLMAIWGVNQLASSFTAERDQIDHIDRKARQQEEAEKADADLEIAKKRIAVEKLQAEAEAEKARAKAIVATPPQVQVQTERDSFRGDCLSEQSNINGFARGEKHRIAANQRVEISGCALVVFEKKVTSVVGVRYRIEILKPTNANESFICPNPKEGITDCAQFIEAVKRDSSQFGSGDKTFRVLVERGGDVEIY
jgi:hypothetical protein